MFHSHRSRTRTKWQMINSSCLFIAGTPILCYEDSGIDDGGDFSWLPFGLMSSVITVPTGRAPSHVYRYRLHVHFQTTASNVCDSIVSIPRDNPSALWNTSLVSLSGSHYLGGKSIKHEINILFRRNRIIFYLYSLDSFFMPSNKLCVG